MKYGYACINTTLQSSNPKIYTNRSMIKKTFLQKGISYASSLALKNIQDLFTIIKWNHQHNITLYRMSSNIFPWMSEYELTDLPDYENISSTCKQIANFISSNNHRITFHPGPFNILSSPNPKIVNNTIKSLNQHSQIMDLLNLPTSPYSKINIHIGGIYKSKSDSIKRFINNFHSLHQNTKSRLTIENDDKPNCYTIQDLLQIHNSTNTPIVLDFLHYHCNPGTLSLQETISLSSQTWPKNITPIIHISESKNTSSPRAHSDFIKNPINTFNTSPDIMIEAKAKEQAVLYFLKHLYITNP